MFLQEQGVTIFPLQMSKINLLSSMLQSMILETLEGPQYEISFEICVESQPQMICIIQCHRMYCQENQRLG